MKTVPLRKLVNEFKIFEVKVKGQESFEIESDEYEEKKDWFVKGLFDIHDDPSKSIRILVCDCLEKDINVSIDSSEINTDTFKSTDSEPTSEYQKELEAEANKLFYVKLLHAPSGRCTNTILIKRREIIKFIDTSMGKFEVGSNQPSFRKDFFVIRVSIEDKTVDCDRA